MNIHSSALCFRCSLLAVTLGIACPWFDTPIWAVVVPLSSKVGPVPAFPGTGLDGEYYSHPDGNALLFLADADNWIGSNSPTATFCASTVRYGFEGGDTVGQVLAVDAASLQPSAIATLPKPANVWRMSGRLAITSSMDTIPGTAPIDVEFALGSDDASRLRIAGTDVVRAAAINLEGDERGVYDPADYRTTVEFEGPGMYSVELVWFDWYGGAHLRWYSTVPGGVSFFNPEGLAGIVPSGILYSAVPEPSTSVLAAMIGLLFSVSPCYRRRSDSRGYN